MSKDTAEAAKPSQLHLPPRTTMVMDGRRVSFRTKRDLSYQIYALYTGGFCLAFEMVFLFYGFSLGAFMALPYRKSVFA